ncbi:MAG: type I restriction endonuclease [Runella zeae]
MDFKDQIKQLSERALKLKNNIQTEEATKNAFIMPFIQSLGYDIFNPLEVVPEFICDIGIKKGEKIDYAIFRDDAPIILIECKHWKQKLDIHDGQLLRYFHVSKAKFAILTNGIIYRFYTDLVEPNKMDEKPFLDINIEDIKDGQIERLKEFHKNYFNPESVFQSASELKYTNELRGLIQGEFLEPKDEFVKYFVKQVYPSAVTAKTLEYFRPLVKRTLSNYISDSINDRLKSAITIEEQSHREEVVEEQPQPIAAPAGKEIETTPEELESFYIVRSILRTLVEPKRVVHRDALSYFAIFLDDNNRKPICRLYLNGGKKYIGTFDADKKETKVEIKSIDDIYQYSEQITTTVGLYK